MINLGVIGKPSDWLIASDVDYNQIKKDFSYNIIDIDIEELLRFYNEIDSDFIINSKFESSLSENEIRTAYKIFLSIKKIVSKYNLFALTIRCFDLLTSIKSTSCLAFALLNDEGIVATCEGDIPSLVTMTFLKEKNSVSSFQSNPSFIDVENRIGIFAHCTIPTKMLFSYSLDTHFESGIGVAIKGEFESNKRISMLKIFPSTKEFASIHGTTQRNNYSNNLCRTQVKVLFDNNIDYFLKNPLGNHHIFYFNHSDAIIENLIRIGYKQVI